MTTNNPLQPEAQKYEENITNLSEQFFSILDDFKKYYVFYNKNPEVNEYANFYLNSKSQLQNVNKEIFLITNSIETNIQKMNIHVVNVNRKLENEKELNGELVKLITNLKGTKNGAATMLDDSLLAYNNQYNTNIEIFAGIGIICVLLFTLFKK